MTDSSPPNSLAAACDQVQLHGWELWIEYFALGGNATPRDLARHIARTATLSDHENDVLVQALNERFSAMDLDHPLSYARPDPPAPRLPLSSPAPRPLSPPP
jgi:hypothetical protein